MDSRKFTKAPNDTDPEEIDRIERESKRAKAAVDGYRYHALKMYYWPVWPEQGEIREQLDQLDKLSVFERDDLMREKGFPDQQQQNRNDESMRALFPDAKLQPSNH